MSKVIISTVGTSLLTNQINRSNPDEKDWYLSLRDTANLKWNEIPDAVKSIIDRLKQRAIQKLDNGQTSVIRRSSAELNGIYGIYEADLSQGKQDIHYLIATDTAQGETAADVVREFLQKNGIANANIYTPPGLSTASTTHFSEGIDELIVWLQQNIEPVKQNQYKICFNLVGSFKSLQGYLNTIGMFYADEIIYIFEGQNSELITIPRLPIDIDRHAIAPYTLQLALMDADAGIEKSQVEGVPESLIGTIGDRCVLSTWGKLVWEQCKLEFLSQTLLNFPRIQYKDSFRADYNKIKNAKERVKLQETLALVSSILDTANGDTSLLKQHTGLQYDKYTNKGDIDHFRVTQGLRISCTASNGTILLHRYGKEPEVNDNPW